MMGYLLGELRTPKPIVGIGISGTYFQNVVWDTYLGTVGYLLWETYLEISAAGDKQTVLRFGPPHRPSRIALSNYLPT